MPCVAVAPRPLQRQAGRACSVPWEVRAVVTRPDNGSRGDVKLFWATLEPARLKSVTFLPHCDHGGPAVRGPGPGQLRQGRAGGTAVETGSSMRGAEGGPCRADWHRALGPPRGAHWRLLARPRTLAPPSGRSCHSLPSLCQELSGGGGGSLSRQKDPSAAQAARCPQGTDSSGTVCAWPRSPASQ